MSALIKIGLLLNGRYRLESLIGRGGAGEVWHATQLDLNRSVAVKVHAPEASTDWTRFRREAQLCAAISHRNVVQIHEFGRHETGFGFIVLELLEGESLSERLSRRFPSPDQSLRWVIGILSGLSAVHRAGVLHRDLKPENVFLVRDADGFAYPKILDFGISRVDQNRASSPELRSPIPTVEGLIVGTPEYMSPEQARAARDLDERADIYSVSAMLYELFSGSPPYRGQSRADVLAAVLAGGCDPLWKLRPDLPLRLAQIVDCGLSTNRDDRFATAEEMSEALSEFVDRSGAFLSAAPLGGTPDVLERSDDLQTAELELADLGTAEVAHRGLPAPRRLLRRWGILAAALTLVVGIGAWITGVETSPIPHQEPDRGEGASHTGFEAAPVEPLVEPSPREELLESPIEVVPSSAAPSWEQGALRPSVQAPAAAEIAMDPPRTRGNPAPAYLDSPGF